MPRMNYPRPLALVTGASSGIGLELSKLFAKNEYDLIVAAEDTELDAVALGVESTDASVEGVRVDLAKPEAVEELWRRVQALDRPLEAACLNAGIGMGGDFRETDLEQELQIVDLN